MKIKFIIIDSIQLTFAPHELQNFTAGEAIVDPQSETKVKTFVTKIFLLRQEPVNVLRDSDCCEIPVDANPHTVQNN